MGKIDIHKATDNEMANSQIDYYIKAGIFKKPGDVNKNTMDITTDRYDTLSDEEQKKWFKKVGNEWWNSVAKDEIISILPTCFPKCVSIPHRANSTSFSTLNFFSTSLNRWVFFFNNS